MKRDLDTISKKIGEEAKSEIVKDEKAAEALEVFHKELPVKGQILFEQWRGDLHPENDTTNYAEDED